MTDNIKDATLALRKLIDSFPDPPPPWLSGYGFRIGEDRSVASLYVELRGDPGAHQFPKEIDGFKIVVFRRKEKESVSP